MLRDIIRLSNEKGCAWITTPKGGAEEFIESLKGTVKGLEAKVYAAGKVPLADLPEDVQQKVWGILRAFDECHVEYENSAFHVGTCVCLQSLYPADHFVAGTYRVEEVYTREERRQNFIEEFGYAPCRI